MMGKATAVILAAGKGTRMRSARPKVLHEVCGITLLECVIEAVQDANISAIVVVVGDKKEEVKDSLKGVSGKIVEQQEQLGTAHAVLSAGHFLSGITDVVMVLNGDAPLIKPKTLKRLITLNKESDADLTLLTAFLDSPDRYGRILRDSRGCIKEINVGMYVFKAKSLLEGLSEIAPRNKKGEFYLTDIISIFYCKGKKVEGFESINTTEVLGINTQRELSAVSQIRRDEIICYFMDKGITIVDPASTFIESHVGIGEGTKVYPFTYICKNVVIGQRCCIGPFAYIKAGTKIEDDVEVSGMMYKAGLFSRTEG